MSDKYRWIPGEVLGYVVFSTRKAVKKGNILQGNIKLAILCMGTATCGQVSNKLEIAYQSDRQQVQKSKAWAVIGFYTCLCN